MLKISQASYQFGSGDRVGPLDLHVRAGEFLVVAGPTGCGKSTLLRMAAGMAFRFGQGLLKGTIAVDERDPGRIPPSERVSLVGFVSQDPSDQIVTGTQGDEIAFGLESAGWDADRIERRVHGLLTRLGLPVEPDRPTDALSGGQRQQIGRAHV